MKKRTGKHCVYIVECNKGTYYTGYTNNLENRIKLHNDGKGAKYTRGRKPVKLVWYKEYKYSNKALHAERDIKKLTRKQKEELVRAYGKTK
jgi:putative endonuclease